MPSAYTFTSSSPYTVGEATKKETFDKTHDNTRHLLDRFYDHERVLGNANWLANSDMLLWSAGITSAPDYWRVTGSGSPTIDRETTTKKLGLASAKITADASNATTFEQRIIQSGSASRILHFLRSAGLGYFSAGILVKYTGGASSVRVGLYDGVGTTYSSYHSGSATGGADADGWEWLTVTRALDSAASELALRVVGAAGTVFYVDAAHARPGYLAPLWWAPEPGQWITLGWHLEGTASTGTAKLGLRHCPLRPAYVLETDLRAGTAPASQALIVDVNKDGTTMYSTRPEIAAAATSGSAEPDSATFATRCLARNSVVTLDVDQVGTGTEGADVTAAVRCWMPVRPHERLLGVSEVA